MPGIPHGLLVLHAGVAEDGFMFWVGSESREATCELGSL